MTKPTIRQNDEARFDADEIENEDPMGEDGFAEGGFQDAPDGGPRLEARDLEDDSVNKHTGKGG